MKIERFEDIIAWQKARQLTKKVYEATKHDPFIKDYGLKDQITRASSSIMHKDQLPKSKVSVMLHWIKTTSAMLPSKNFTL